MSTGRVHGPSVNTGVMYRALYRTGHPLRVSAGPDLGAFRLFGRTWTQKSRGAYIYTVFCRTPNKSIATQLKVKQEQVRARAPVSHLWRTGPHIFQSHRFLTKYLVLNTEQFLPPPRRLCNRRYFSVCLLVTLRKNFQTDLHEIFREGWQWATEHVAIRITDPGKTCFDGGMYYPSASIY